MRKRTKTVRSTAKVKAGVMCPACSDEIFSLHRHDFRRCRCGKVFVDGGDDHMRFGAEPPVDFKNVICVYRPQNVAEKAMSREVRDKIPLAPPPLSYFTDSPKYQFVWRWDRWAWPRNYGAYPKSPAKFAGCIYSWVFAIGPLEIRRWADSKPRN